MGEPPTTDAIPARTLSLRVRSNRQGFETVRRIAELSITELRQHLSTDLRGLPLEGRSRDFVLWLLSPFRAPDDDEFWGLLAYADAHPGRADQWLTKAITQGEVVIPAEWRDPAVCLLRVAASLRTNARLTTEEWSARYRVRWQRGDTSALAAMVRDDGVNEAWVQDAIREQRTKQLTGNAQEHAAADKLLHDVGAALSYVGKGPRSESTPEAKEHARREREALSKALRRLTRRYKREMRGMPAEAADRVYRHTVEAFRETTKLARPLQDKVVQKFAEQFRLD